MSVSKRAQDWALKAPQMLWCHVIKDLWHIDSNPDGFVSLGVAENALMHDDLTKYINDNINIPVSSLTYVDGPGGSRALRKAMAHFLTRKFKPVVAFDAQQICITNGVTSAIEHITTVLADPGDAFLLGQPYYGGFIDDMELRTGVIVQRVFFKDVDPLALDAVAAYEDAIKICQAKGQRVAGLMLCNPHNPLGRCYTREYLVELMKLCNRYQIHLVSDEIYAMSVFRTPDSTSEQVSSLSASQQKTESEPEIAPFTSLSSISTEGLIDPRLTHLLYGLSKDFGANGLRLGCVASQYNPELIQALQPIAIYSYPSSLTDCIATTLLKDDKFIDWFVEENCKRLEKHHDMVRAWAESHQIGYTKGVNAAFFLWVDLGEKYRKKLEKEGKQAISDEKLTDVVSRALLDQKVFLASGTGFGSEKDGWFRIVFSQLEDNLMEGLRRIERALGLGESETVGSSQEVVNGEPHVAVSDEKVATAPISLNDEQVLAYLVR